MVAIAPGTDLGTYRIVEEIGRGGMGRVYKAYHAALDRDVAIKMLDGAVAHDEEFVERFRREARVIAHLRHPNILPIYDFGVYEGIPFFVMEYVPAGTLTSERLANLSKEERQRVAYDIAAAIDYAHSHGVTHRDIKPQNVLITEDGRAVLTDFGLARVQSSQSKLTVAGTLIGSPEYMPPEQALGQSSDARSDLYSFGVLLYEMMTGKTPFQGEVVALLYAHVHTPPPAPSSINSSLNQKVDAALLKSLAKKPEDRFATARAAVEALFPAPPPTATPTRGGVPLKAIIIGASVEVVILTVAFFIWYAVSYQLFVPPPPPPSIAPNAPADITPTLPKPPLVPAPDQVPKVNPGG